MTEITRHVWKNWPDEWAEERVERPDILRLIFQVCFDGLSDKACNITDICLRDNHRMNFGMYS